MSKDKQLSAKQQNLDVWKHVFDDQIRCKRNDMKCWTNLLPHLPCQIDNQQCWKSKLPDIPCQKGDSQCWRRLLPQLPCKVQDHDCWKEIKNGQVLREVNPHEQKTMHYPPPRSDGYNPYDYFVKKYGGLVTSQQTHRWII